MIYLTGDCHGDFHRFARRQREKLSVEPGEGDQVIVCGDLGLLWAKDREFEYHLKWLSGLRLRFSGCRAITKITI